jgi:hypothetical protein
VFQAEFVALAERLALVEVSSPHRTNRMPVILAPGDYDRWLGDDLDPADLIRPYPIDDMVKFPVSARVNKPENDDATILEDPPLRNHADDDGNAREVCS